MDGSSKYELLQKIAGDKIIAFRGRLRDGSQTVLLHRLTAGNDHSDVLRMAVQYLLRSPASTGGCIVDLVEIQGASYVVTADQPECLGLREWLKWELQRGRPAAGTAPAPAREPGEFTRLFEQPGAAPVAAPAPLPRVPQPAATPLQPVAPRPAAVPPPVTSPPMPKPAPGEFTQLFGSVGQKPVEAPPLQPPAMPPAAAPPLLASEKGQPGEFTRLFRSPLEAPAEIPSDQLPGPSYSSRTPGEFTRIFGEAGLHPPSAPSASSSAVPPSMVPVSPSGQLIESLEPLQVPGVKRDIAQPSASTGPGEFTRVILGSGGAAAGTPPAAPASAAPEAAPELPIAMPAAPTPPAVSQPAHPPSMPKAPSKPARSIPSPPAAASPQQSSGARQPPVLFILFVVLLIAALALIVVAVLRH